MSTIPLGRFCWYELLTKDAEAAPGFYGKIAGWGVAPWQTPGGPPYAMWMNGPGPIGGLMALPEEARKGGAPSHWLAHISTPDLKSTVARAKELGGSILTEMSVPTVGSFAIVRDPQGAVFSAFQPQGDAPGHDGEARIGEFSWHELATTDGEAAWSFYSGVFGWVKADAMDMGEMGTYQMFGRGAQMLGGVFRKPPEMPVAAWLLYIRVPDADEAADKVRSLGGTVLNGPVDVPGGGRIAQCADPQGAAFAVHSTAPA